MQGAPGMPPPQMPDILPLTQPRAAIDEKTSLKVFRGWFSRKVRNSVEEGRRFTPTFLGHFQFMHRDL